MLQLRPATTDSPHQIEAVVDGEWVLRHREIGDEHVAGRAPQAFDQRNRIRRLIDDGDTGLHFQRGADAKENEWMIVRQDNSKIHQNFLSFVVGVNANLQKNLNHSAHALTAPRQRTACQGGHKITAPSSRKSECSESCRETKSALRIGQKKN